MQIYRSYVWNVNEQKYVRDRLCSYTMNIYFFQLLHHYLIEYNKIYVKRTIIHTHNYQRECILIKIKCVLNFISFEYDSIITRLNLLYFLQTLILYWQVYKYVYKFVFHLITSKCLQHV